MGSMIVTVDDIPHEAVQRVRSITATSMSERWEDTLRVVSGYVDVTVARLGRPIVRTKMPDGIGSFLNGGDTGDYAEHPSQALIGIFAMERAMGPLDELTVALCGDLNMRSTRSLLSLLARTPPKKLLCTTLPELLRERTIPQAVQHLVEFRESTDLGDADVVYVTGLSHSAVDERKRHRLRITRDVVESLQAHAIVLSPMPVVDEIASTARSNHRVQILRQSDEGLFVRMALLEELVGGMS